MASSDLTTLVDVKTWLNISDTKSDALLARLITSISGQILSVLNRSSINYSSKVETRNGNGNTNLLLRDWPVIAVSQLTIDNDIIPQAVPVNGSLIPAGWVLSIWSGAPPGIPQVLSLRGYYYRQGVRNVSVSYTSGYYINGETTTIITGGIYTALQQYGYWSIDSGVVFSDTNIALIAIASGTPTIGHYTVSGGVYQFALADVGRPLKISYNYIPFGIEQAAMEAVSERFKARDRIGARSKSLGGQETVTYDSSGLSATVMSMLNPWISVIPFQP